MAHARARILSASRAHDRARRNAFRTKTSSVFWWARATKSTSPAKCPANSPSAAASSTFSRRRRRSPCASSFWATRSNPSALSTPIRSAPPIPLSAPRFCRSPNFRIRRSSAARRSAAPRSGREDEAIERGFYPGWEFREILREERNAVLFDLAGDPLFILDEPSALEAAAGKISRAPARRLSRKWKTRSPSRPTAIFSAKKNGRWPCSFFRSLALEHLAIAQEGPRSARACRRSRPRVITGTWRRFMAEVKGALAAGEHVMVSAASTGELERFADICHEYELPYRWASSKRTSTVTRLAEEGSSGTAPGDGAGEGAAFAKASRFPKRSSRFMAMRDLFETLPPPRSAPERGRRRPASSAIFPT